jgi:hypothetical protein
MDLVQPEHSFAIFVVDEGKIEGGIPHRERLHPDPQKMFPQRQPRHDDPENSSNNTNNDVIPLQEWEIHSLTTQQTFNLQLSTSKSSNPFELSQ